MRLSIIARLSTASRAILEAAAEPNWEVTFERSTQRLLGACAGASYDVLVLDPLDPILTLRAVSRSNQSRRALPPTVLLLSDISMQSLQAIQLTTTPNPPQIAWCGPDCNLRVLNDAIHAASATRMATRMADYVLHELDSRGLDGRIEPFVLGVFRTPWEYRRADSVIRKHAMTSEMLNSLLARAGLSSFQKLRRAARTVHIRDMLEVSRLSIPQLADRLQCGSADTIIRDVQRVLGVSPSRLLDGLTRETLASRVGAYCVRHEPRHGFGRHRVTESNDHSGVGALTSHSA